MADKYAMMKSKVVEKLAAEIISKRKKELGHIDLREIQFAWRFSEKSKYHARTKLIRGDNRIFTDKKISIVVWRKSWKAHDEAWQALLIYHELKHILEPNKKGEYRLVKHDVEDFAFLIKLYGIRWEKASLFLEELRKAV